MKNVFLALFIMISIGCSQSSGPENIQFEKPSQDSPPSELSTAKDPSQEKAVPQKPHSLEQKVDSEKNPSQDLNISPNPRTNERVYDKAPIRNEHGRLGTGDSGGGNGFNGRALEDYRVRVQSLTSFQNIVNPLIQKLKLHVPELAMEIEFIFKSKVWYLIPESLATIEPGKIGVAFATEQLALQNNYEIWLDKTKFEKMTLEQQSTLLLHEAFMGMKISRDQEYQKQLATHDFIENLARRVQNKNQIEINKTDYEHIRSITSKVLDQHFITDLDGFINDLKVMKFGIYISYQELQNIRAAYAKSFTTDELMSFLGSEAANENLPPTCEYLEEKFALRVTKHSKDYSVSKDIKLDIQSVTPTINWKGLVRFEVKTKSSESYGSARQILVVTIFRDRVQSFEFRDQVYTVSLSRGLEWKDKNGSNASIVCSY